MNCHILIYFRATCLGGTSSPAVYRTSLPDPGSESSFTSGIYVHTSLSSVEFSHTRQASTSHSRALYAPYGPLQPLLTTETWQLVLTWESFASVGPHMTARATNLSPTVTFLRLHSSQTSRLVSCVDLGMVQCAFLISGYARGRGLEELWL